MTQPSAPVLGSSSHPGWKYSMLMEQLISGEFVLTGFKSRCYHRFDHVFHSRQDKSIVLTRCGLDDRRFDLNPYPQETAEAKDKRPCAKCWDDD